MELIPSIDLRGGYCVRLFQGNFATETRYEFTHDGLYERFAAMGARWLHVVDLDGARDGTQSQLPLIESLARRARLKLQVGGGLRDRADIDRTLVAGVDRVVLGSVAVTLPEFVEHWLRELGPDSTVLALDVRIDRLGTPRLVTHGWTGRSPHSLWDMVARYRLSGLRHVLCTDVERDGTMAGPNVGLYARAVQRFPDIAWQASGGIRDVRDLAALAATGVSAAVSGRALLEDCITNEELRVFWSAA